MSCFGILLLCIPCLALGIETLNLGLFLSNMIIFSPEGVGKYAGFFVAVDKINRNASVVQNLTLRSSYNVTNCRKKKILSACIEFISVENLDAMVGDQCQDTTELAGLVAAEYNLPFFDFATVNRYLLDPEYGGVLLRISGGIKQVRLTFNAVTASQNMKKFCYYMPEQYSGHIRQVFKAIEKSPQFFYYDLRARTRQDRYAAGFRRIQMSCRGKRFCFRLWFRDSNDSSSHPSVMSVFPSPLRWSFRLCLSICLSVCPSVHPSIPLSVCLSVHPSILVSVHPYIHPSLCLSVRPSVSVCSACLPKWTPLHPIPHPTLQTQALYDIPKSLFIQV